MYFKLLILVLIIILILIILGFVVIHRLKSVPIINYKLVSSNSSSEIAVVMVNINDPRGPYSVPLWKQYCKMHGYDFIELDDPLTFNKSKLHPSWWKIPLCKSVFKKGNYKFILHVDADTIPIKLENTIYNYIDPTDSSVFWICRESSGVKARMDFGSINAGVFILKNDHYVHKMLKKIWHNRYKTSIDWPWEQGAIESFISKSLKKSPGKVNILDYGTLQSFYLEDDGCNLLNLDKCPNDNAFIAHVLRGAHENWVEIYEYYLSLRGIA
jgi:hypothetical protein